MKRIGAIACLTALLIMISATFSFGAADLKLESTYPTDGQTNTTKENMCVKLYFNNAVGNDVSKKANKECFKITSKDGKTSIPIQVLYNPKDEKQAMILADTANSKVKIKDDTEYVLTVSGDFIDNNGKALGNDEKITFKTQNQAKSTKIYMIMMVVMFGGMFFFSSQSMKKQRREQAAEQQRTREEKVNPYKESKKTGKSVEQIVADTEKEKAKREAKEAKRAARKAAGLSSDDEDDDNGNYKVKRPRPISEGGASYVTGRKAIAEAKAAEEERRTKKAAANKKKKKK